GPEQLGLLHHPLHHRRPHRRGIVRPRRRTRGSCGRRLMNLPIEGNAALVLAVVFGMIFGFLLHRGGVADYNVIVNQFRLIDFRVLKIMLTAILVGGAGVLAMQQAGWATAHIKPAMLLGVIGGSAIFGVGMVLY